MRRRKVHATVINTKHRRAPPKSGGGRRGGGRYHEGRSPVDASALLAAYEHHTLATGRVEGIHLSRLGPNAEDGYYRNDATVSFP